MPLYVIALPRLAPADAEAIEALRRGWDPQAALLPAHVTLVFPRPAAEEATLIARARRVPAATAAFDLELAGTAVVESGPAPSFYRYLLPRRGGEALQTLHRALNERPLTDFAPHVTLGRFASRRRGRRDRNRARRRLDAVFVLQDGFQLRRFKKRQADKLFSQFLKISHVSVSVSSRCR